MFRFAVFAACALDRAALTAACAPLSAACTPPSPAGLLAFGGARG